MKLKTFPFLKDFMDLFFHGVVFTSRCVEDRKRERERYSEIVILRFWKVFCGSSLEGLALGVTAEK